MKRKLITMALLAGMLLSGLTSCGQDDEEQMADASAKTKTLTITAITGSSTTEEAILAVQEAMNKITKSELKTQVILQLKTAEEYVEYVDKQVEALEAEIEAEEARIAEEKAKKKAQKEAEKAANAGKKNRSKWTTTTKAETEEDTAETQEMTVDEYGRPVVKYPDLEGASLDIVFVTGTDMLDYFVENEYLAPLNAELSGNSKILNKYLNPHCLQAGIVENQNYAIANNRAFGEYTYFLIDKSLATKYKMSTKRFTTLTDFEPFLDQVKANEPDYVPISDTVDFNYVRPAGYDGSMIGAHIKATYTTEARALFKNFLEYPQYIEHYTFVDKLESQGYVGEGEKYAIEVVTGSAFTKAEAEAISETHEIFIYEKPFCTNEEAYTGMFAVSAYAEDLERCMEVVTLLNTSQELHDIYAFGVEGVNFEYNKDGTVHMLNDEWSMDFFHCGNAFIGAVPDTMPADYVERGKIQNLDVVTDPFFRWRYFTEDNAELYADYEVLSTKYMDAFMNSNDKTAYVASIKEEMAADEVLKRMLDAGDEESLFGSYIQVFYRQTYKN